MMDSSSVVEPQAQFERLYRNTPTASMPTRCGVRRRARPTTSSPRCSSWSGAGCTAFPEEPLPWLLGVARRVLANRRRSESRAAALHERLADPGSAPDA